MHGQCERCGSSIGLTINLAVIDPLELKFAADAICITCGYNLRTLPVASVCPECATPVLRSLRPDDLRFADPRYLRRVRRGVALLLTAALGVLATVLLAQVLMPVMAVKLSFAPGRSLGWAVVALASLGTLITLFVFWCIGVFLVTAQDPYPRAKPESRVAAYLARVCTLAAPLIALTAIYASFYFVFVHVLARGSPTGPSSRSLWTSVLVPWLAVYLSVVVFICAVVALAVCLRRLARRARQIGLARLTSVVLWIGVVWIIMLPATAVVQALIIVPFMTNAMTTAITATMPAAFPATLPAGITPTTSPAVGTTQYKTIGPAVGTTQYGPITVVTTSPAVTYVQAGAGASTVTTTFAAPQSSTTNPLLVAAQSVLTCAMMLFAPAIYISGVITLFRYRRMLATVLAGAR